MGLKYSVFTNFMDQSLILTSYEKLLILWTSLISVDRLDLQVVIVYVGVSKIFVLVRKVRDVWEWLNCMPRAAMSRCGFRSVRYLEVKNTLQKRFGTKDSVRCSEFRGGRFSEVANVLQVWDFQSVTRTLSALGSVSASRSVRSGRFYCSP